MPSTARGKGSGYRPRNVTPLQSFLELRSALRTERIGDGGIDVCDALTGSLDTAIAELGSDLPSGVVVVAIGGYGRREQCVWSDVDVMILHGHSDPEPLVKSVLYPLWDADLKVGHAVRTVDENRTHAAQDFESLTSLLSARRIAGDEELFDSFMEMVTELIRKRPLAPRLVAAERERRAADPYPTMTADVKNGRGGLRTHHGFWWERRRAQLIGLPVDEPSEVEIEARAQLLAIRNALHASSSRAQDRFLVDLRAPAAAWVGTEVAALARAFTDALHTGDLLADKRWPDLHAEQDPMVSLGRRIFGVIKSRFSTDSDEPGADSSDRILSIAVRAAARRDGAWFTPEEEAQIAASGPTKWTAGDRACFIKLLSAGARGRTIFGRLEVLGWVGREFPEWGPIATAPQFAPFHDHPVGAHLWRAVDEMQRLIEGGGMAGEVAEDVGSTEELLLAAFLHDIGKARGGNHADVGGALAAKLLRRAGFGAATTGVVVEAVRLHLLLPETATRRDIANLDVIDDVADRVSDVHLLDVLYLLTIADLKATGTTMWNEWRRTLIDSLYLRVREAIEEGGARPATPGVGAIVAAGTGIVDQRDIEEHVAAMPDDYLGETMPREILWHIEVIKALDDVAAVSVDPDDPGRVLVVGADRSGFLLAVTRAFTANGVSILDARLRTRSDGIALDTFHVVRDRSGEAVPESRWKAIVADLRRSLGAGGDLRPAIRERVKAYHRVVAAGAVEVRTWVTDRRTVVEVRAPDRIGLLADIVEALHGDGLDIHLARIDTMGGVARDLFYVRRIGGIPIRDESELATLRGRIQDKLRG